MRAKLPSSSKERKDKLVTKQKSKLNRLNHHQQPPLQRAGVSSHDTPKGSLALELWSSPLSGLIAE